MKLFLTHCAGRRLEKIKDTVFLIYPYPKMFGVYLSQQSKFTSLLNLPFSIAWHHTSLDCPHFNIIIRNVNLNFQGKRLTIDKRDLL